MSILSNSVRQFWLPGLNDVAGASPSGLSVWLRTKDYQFYDPLQTGIFNLTISNITPFLSAIAFDCNRMAMASFESMAAIQKLDTFPKSTAWLVIQTYYSAFFAAHTILRMMGISCSRIESSVSSEIYLIAKMFGQLNGMSSVSDGQYVCTFDSPTRKLNCIKENDKSHEGFWKKFCAVIQQLSSDILTYGKHIIEDQQVSVKLIELCECLKTAPYTRGNWLSSIRNRVNYSHELGTWFPYKSQNSLHEYLHNSRAGWLYDPMEIEMAKVKTDELQRFNKTCHFIIGMCRILVMDMSQRCSTNKSFLKSGAVRFLNLMNQ